MTMAAVGAIIGAGAGIYGARKAGKEAKKARAHDQRLMDMQQARADQLDAFGKPLLSSGQQNMDLVQAYLRNLGSGDRSAMAQVLAPEINSMSDQFRGSVNTARNMMPRGGAGAAASADLPRQFQSGVNNLMFQARPQAMSMLGSLGSNQAQLGLGAMGQGSGLTNNMMNYGLQARGQLYDWGANAGAGIMNNALLGSMLGGNMGSFKWPFTWPGGNKGLPPGDYSVPGGSQGGTPLSSIYQFPGNRGPA